MTISVINIIMLIAVAQGFLLAVLIFQKHGKLFANRFLGSLMFLYSAIILNMVVTDLDYNYRFPHAVLFLNGVVFLIGPLHYLYAKKLIYSTRRFKKTEWFHFLPVLLYEFYFIPEFLKPKGEIVASIQSIYVKGLPLNYIIFDWAIALQGLTYMILTISILKRYSRDIKKVFSSIEKIKLDWLRNITYVVIFVLLIFITENVFYLGGINLSNYFNLTSLLFAVSVYAMGYLGLLRSEIFSESEFTESMSQLSILSHHKQLDLNKASSAAKYQKSGLSPEKAKEHLQDLLRLMKDEKPYTDSNLTLAQLAKILSISPHNLSEILNTQLNQSFFDFVNQYRVEEAKKDLTNPAKRHLKIMAIAFDAGFNSKTSFNTIFKKYTNLTPSEFRQQAILKKAF